MNFRFESLRKEKHTEFRFSLININRSHMIFFFNQETDLFSYDDCSSDIILIVGINAE